MRCNPKMTCGGNNMSMLLSYILMMLTLNPQDIRARVMLDALFPYKDTLYNSTEFNSLQANVRDLIAKCWSTTTQTTNNYSRIYDAAISGGGGGIRKKKKQQWISTGSTVVVPPSGNSHKHVKRTVYRNLRTGELRIRKMVNDRIGGSTVVRYIKF